MHAISLFSSRVRPIRLAALALVVVCSCRSQTPSSEGPPAVPEAVSNAAPSPQSLEPAVPQPPAAPSPIPVGLAQASVLDTTVQLSGDQVTVVDPAAHFLVEARARLDDARLVLVDEQDSMVPVEGTTELGATTRFTLVPNGPLIPGSSYTLRLEGVARREIRDSEGRSYLPSVLRLRTIGEKPHAAPARKTRGAKKRR